MAHAGPRLGTKTPSHRSGSAAGALSTRRAPAGDTPSHRSGSAAGALSTRRAPAGDEEAENKLPTLDAQSETRATLNPWEKWTCAKSEPRKRLKAARRGPGTEKGTNGCSEPRSGGRCTKAARPGPGCAEFKFSVEVSRLTTFGDFSPAAYLQLAPTICSALPGRDVGELKVAVVPGPLRRCRAVFSN